MKAVNHGFRTLRYLGPKLCEILPSHLKKIDSLKNFKNAIKNENQNRANVGSAKYIYKT